MHPIIVIGSNHHNTFSMVKSFGCAGHVVDVILFGCSSSYIEKSKYVRRITYIPSPSDIIDALSQVESSEKPIIVSCSDVVSQITDAHYDELKERFWFFHCGKQNALTPFMDKNYQTRQAGECGMNVPFTAIYAKGVEVESYPCLLKPLESINGGKHIEICHNESELTEKAAVFSPDTTVLVQSYIQKKSEIVVVGLSLGKEIIIPGYIYKIRESSGGTTYSRVMRLQRLDVRLVERCKRLVTKMNYTGLFGIEFIEDDKGDYYFIEINLRNDATTYSLVKAGVNLPVMYAEYCSGSETVQQPSEIDELYSIVDFKDLENAIHQNVSIWQWLREYRNAQCKYYKDDPKPYRVCLKSFVKSHLLHKLRIKKWIFLSKRTIVLCWWHPSF